MCRPISQTDRQQSNWLVNQGGVVRPWGGEATGGCRATNHGKRQADFTLSAVEDISGIP